MQGNGSEQEIDGYDPIAFGSVTRRWHSAAAANSPTA